jgi:hypothetical protein
MRSNKIENTFVLIGIIILIGGIWIVVGQYSLQNHHIKKLERTISNLGAENKLIKQKINTMVQRLICQYENENIILDSDIEIWNSSEKLLLKDLLNKRNFPTVIFRYSELHCQECVNAQIKTLKDFANDIGYDNVLLLANYKNNNDLSVFKRLNQLRDMKIYQVDSLNISIEEFNLPYVFVVDKNMSVQLLFIPDKELSDLDTEYYKIIKRKFFRRFL